MMRWTWGQMALVALVGGTLAACSPPTGEVEDKDPTPGYQVASAENEFEIRSYEAQTVAMTTQRGSYRQAVEQGYINLEKYFLGENAVPEAMKIGMPIMVREEDPGGWTTIFPLPREYRVETAPPPNDRRIRVVEVPPRRVAVIKFPGALGEGLMREQSARLDAWLSSQGIAHAGDWTLASTDLGWVPAKWRSNEVLVTLK